jgi:hypothetical protein
VRSRRAFAYAEPRVHALAAAQGGALVGYAVAKADDPRSFELVALDPAPAPGAPAARLPTIPTGELTPCRTPAGGADATDVRLANAGYVPQLRVAYQQIVTPLAATIELAGGGACLRSLESWNTLDAQRPSYGGYGAYYGAPRGLSLTSGPDGRLSGFQDDGSTTQVLACTR